MRRHRRRGHGPRVRRERSGRRGPWVERRSTALPCHSWRGAPPAAEWRRPRWPTSVSLLEGSTTSSGMAPPVAQKHERHRACREVYSRSAVAAGAVSAGGLTTALRKRDGTRSLHDAGSSRFRGAGKKKTSRLRFTASWRRTYHAGPTRRAQTCGWARGVPPRPRRRGAPPCIKCKGGLH